VDLKQTFQNMKIHFTFTFISVLLSFVRAKILEGKKCKIILTRLFAEMAKIANGKLFMWQRSKTTTNAAYATLTEKSHFLWF
jgi:hypothetical protein